ncbi:MAG TPA: hypothetical protein VFV86_07395, partial [Nitrososphaeraceae archaeon]|nr:hypothetical protein [Nitrososphaeraceae archaeon]
KRCHNEWLYKGNNLYYASCSTCKTSVKVKKNIAQSQPAVGQPNVEIEPEFNCLSNHKQCKQPAFYCSSETGVEHG